MICASITNCKRLKFEREQALKAVKLLKRRISIIEDDASLCVALVGLVRSLGYEPTGFRSAEQFFQSVRIDQFDCIITDIQLPQMSGIDLKRQLNKQGALIPVIMITARTELALETMAIEIGAVGFLRKPFDMNELVECLQKVLEH